MCKCLISGEELPAANTRMTGYECRESGRYTCPNYMHYMSNGRNCRLLLPNNLRYAKLSLRETLEPIKEAYREKSREELKEMYEKFKLKHLESGEAKSRVLLRAQLGAIEELLKEKWNETA